MILSQFRDGDIVTAEDPSGAMAAQVGGVSIKNAIIYGTVFWAVTRLLDGTWDVFKTNMVSRMRRR